MAQTATSGLSDGDEFVGPFASWTNVKTTYGAVGDGVADDTAALQNALNNVGVGYHSPVIYLPAGTYRITSELNIAGGRQGISIIGQDPSSTAILWAGAAGTEMLYLNGVSYAKFSRITWNGAGTALTALDFGWDGLSSLGGSTYVENSDEVFENLSYGIRGGSLGYEDSEHAILRCKFLNITTAGISVENFNALDFYVWDCTFVNNYVGVTNGGGGNFHVYGSLFQSSTHADIDIGPTSFFSLRQNFSQNSNAFLVADPVGSSSSSITLQSNIILDTTSSPLQISNVGTVMMFDNIVRGGSNQFGPLVTVMDSGDSTPIAGGLVVMGNVVSQNNWYSVPNGGEVIDINNNVVSRSAINNSAPAMPGALPNYNRQIFEVAPGSTDVAIQAAIDAAVSYNGQRPVVHLPTSTYYIANTIVLPVGSDVQLIGDGGSAVGASNLNWAGSTSGPVLRLAGPSRAALRDLNVIAGGGTGIVVENTDQANGRVFMEQLDVQNLSQYGLFVNGLDNASVILHDGYVVSDNIGIQVTGGPNANAGQAVLARNDMFAGLTASNNLSYNINSHGRLMSQDVWYEGGPAQLVNLSDSGTFTLQSAHIGAQDAGHGGVQQNIPTFEVNNFNGAVTLLGAQLAVRNTVGVLGSGSNTSMLAMGLLGPYDNPNFFVNSTSPQGQVAMVDSHQATITSGSVTVPDQGTGIGSIATFISGMVAQTRNEQAKPFSVLSSGITDARFYRVSVNYGGIGVEVDPGGPSSTTAPAISGVSSSLASSSSAIISWVTDQLADSQVVYGTTSAYGSTSALNTNEVTAHSVTLQNLVLGTTYHYAVKSRSLSGYVTISADQTFTTPTNSSSSGFISTFNLGAPRNNYTGWVGMEFTVGSSVPLISSLGRMTLSGNSGTHTLKLVRAGDGTDVPGGSATVSMSAGTPGRFAYAALSSPVYLAANTSYYLVSSETTGGDQWYDISSVTFTNIAQVIGAIYTGNTGTYAVGAAGTEAFVPVDFTYQVSASDTTPPAVSVTNPSAGATLSGQVAFTANATDNVAVASVQLQIDGGNFGPALSTAPYTITWDTTTVLNGTHTLSAIAKDSSGNTAIAATVSVTVANTLASGVPLVSGFTQGALRNNSSSFVGMEFTVGSTPIAVNSLGRYYYPGNSGSHLVKLVQANTGLDVQGGSVTVSLPSGNAGQFAYVSLASPVQLSANTSYYLISQEFSGGDQWSDVTPVTTSGVATVNGPAYNYGTGYFVVSNAAGQSYLPVGLLYTLSNSSAAPAVAITSPASGATVSGSISVTAAANAATGLAIASIQFQLDGTNLGSAVTASPYTTSLVSAAYGNGTHAVTAIATDSSGNSATSSSVSISISNTTSSGGSSTAFVSGQSSGVVRNNFSGYVGMQFTVGNAPVVITSLGRLYVGGNSAVHTVKLVQASNGADVQSGSVSLQGGTAGQYTYAALASPLTLSANTAYYLVSQETSAGDQWYDIAPVTYATGVATVNGAIYEGTYIPYTLVSLPGNSYVPVNFLYQSAGSAATNVAITAPTAGATLSGSAVALAASVSSSLAISSVQFQIDGVNAGSALTSSPYTSTFDSTTWSNGTHALTAIATDSSGATTASASVSVTISNTYSAPSGTALLTSFTARTLRNNYSGLVGMKITVGANPISVSALGRIYVAGNSSSHIVKLVQASTGSDVAGGSANVTPSSGTAGQFSYVSLATPVILAANTSYFLVSTEVNAGDQWYQITPVIGSGAASIDGPVYWGGSSISLVDGLPNQSYVPVNLLYTSVGSGGASGAPPTVTITAPAAGATVAGTVAITAAASSAGSTISSVQFQVDGVNVGGAITTSPYTSTFDSTLLSNGTHSLTAVATDSGGNSSTSSSVSVTVNNSTVSPTGTAILSGFTPSSLRNNFSGYVGMQLTVGSSPITVTALGRLYVSGNAGQHTVKLVNASTGVDVPGSAVNVSVSAGAAGQFTYVSLASSVSLPANTAYYLVSQETSGGDQWYDVTPVTVASSVVSIIAPVYNNGYGYSPVSGLAGESYVPVNLLYTSITSAVPSVSITSPGAGASVSGPFNATATATPANGLTIANVYFAVDGVSIGNSGSTSPYSVALDSTMLTNGTHSLTAVAVDSAGNSGTSSSVSITVSNANVPGFSLLTGYAPGTLRNTYSGFVGMQFTVGATPITVTSLGRLYLPGNTGTHVLKLALASSGADVPGASVTISLPGPGAGQFTYGSLASPVTLSANTSYYLVSNETYGGDQWYNITPVSGTTAVSLDGPVYNDGYRFALVSGLASQSYVPVSLLYQ